MPDNLTPEQALREALQTADDNAIFAAWWDVVPHRLAELGYRITPIDPEAEALAELLRLRATPAFTECFGEYITIEYGGTVWSLWDREAGRNPLRMDGTAVKVLAAVKAKLGVA